MSKSSFKAVLLAALVLALAVLAAGCGGDDDDEASGDTAAADTSEDTGAAPDGKIAVLLPDSQSSDRWEADDRRFFEQAFAEAGVESIISNAEGDAAAQQTQAEQAITNGAKVILLVNLDSGSGAAIIENAKAQDVPVIDYDRLTVEGDGASYYVSFDNEAVGRLQGEGLVQCIEEGDVATPAIAVLNGSPTDNNATLFKNGYDSVINPKFESGDWTEVDDQSVPDWDNQQALTIFEQMLQKANNKVDGVLAANDGLGGAAISAIKSRNLENIPVTGQDATTEGIQHVLAGEQCMTVYKAIKAEAEAAAALAISLLEGEEPEGADDTVNNGTTDVPSVLLEPVSIFNDVQQITDTVIADGFRTWEEICVGEYAQYCPPESERS